LLRVKTCALLLLPRRLASASSPVYAQMGFGIDPDLEVAVLPDF
jgi:hypothetical protein